MNKFGQSHIFKYDVLLMNNNKYLIWKLIFPRIGDTFVSLDKMMDLVTWEGVYKLMEQITADCGSWAEDQSVSRNYMRYKIQIQKTRMDVPHKHLVDVNYELLHCEYMMCMYVSLSENEIWSNTAFTINYDIPSQLMPDTIITTGNSPEEKKYEIGSENLLLPRKRSNSALLLGSSSKRRVESTVVEMTYNGIKIPTNFEQLREQMKDAAVMTQFGLDDTNKRFFDKVYTLRDGRFFAAFHNSFIIENMRQKADVELFFCFSPELVTHFKGLENICQTLIVYVMLFDQVIPFGYFLLENTIRHTFANAIRVIVQWLNGESSAGQACNSSNVTKCVVPHDRDLQFAIRKYWPNVQLIGCSTQYQREVCEFISKKQTPKENAEAFLRGKKKLMNFARSLCYLPEHFISTGIGIIEDIEIHHEKLMTCKMQLLDNLRNKWRANTISVFNEKSVYRTLQICAQFNIQIKKELKSEHVWKAIEMLKEFNRRVEVDFRESISTGCRQNANTNTPKQMKRERIFWGAVQEFEEDLQIMREDEAVMALMEKFFEN